MRNNIKSLPKCDMPREKIKAKGVSSLSDTELLAVLLSSGTKNKSSLEVASDIIRQNENYDVLGCIGGLLYQNGVPVAFTAGTKLDNEVFDAMFYAVSGGSDSLYVSTNADDYEITLTCADGTIYYGEYSIE